nr:MAG TPA: hypothetical protein [Caudoviricetes sp.]
MAGYVPTPLDTLVEYIGRYPSEVGVKILTDIVNSRRLPTISLMIEPICVKWITNLPRRSEKELLDISKKRVNRPVELDPKTGASAYIYAAHAEQREMLTRIAEKTRELDDVCAWTEASGIDGVCKDVLTEAVDEARESVRIDTAMMLISSKVAVIVGDVMIALEDMYDERLAIGGLSDKAKFLVRVYAARSCRSPEAWVGKVWSYVSAAYRKQRNWS